MQPYTYIIEHIPTGKKYYGVKFSKDSDPNDLWKEYFTSSKVVKDLIEKTGEESFAASVDKVFDTPEEAIEYELNFLRSIKDRSNWLNQNFGSGYDINVALYKTDGHKKKISEANKKSKTGKALKACIKNARLGTEARRGMKDSEETKRKRAQSLSKALTGVPQPNRRKKIIIEGKSYIGVQSVCDEFNVTRQTVSNRIKSDKWDWRYATAD